MIRNLKRRSLCFVAAVAACLPGAAMAGTLNMIIGNVDIQFVGGTEELFEVGDPDLAYDEMTMTFDEGEAQSVSSTEFEVDGVTIPGGLLMDPPDSLFVDLFVPNLGPTLAFGSLEENQGGPDAVLSWFTDTGEFLRLALDPITYSALNFPSFNLASLNIVTTATVIDQNLPTALPLGSNVLVSFTATDAMFLNGGGLALASGAVTITGALVPEPGTLGLLMTLSAASGVTRRRR
ncbi:MAG: PEP-CTERM sorting domain-containing protein [Planctomycetota bacterium]